MSASRPTSGKEHPYVLLFSFAIAKQSRGRLRIHDDQIKCAEWWSEEFVAEEEDRSSGWAQLGGSFRVSEILNPAPKPMTHSTLKKTVRLAENFPIKSFTAR